MTLIDEIWVWRAEWADEELPIHGRNRTGRRCVSRLRSCPAGLPHLWEDCRWGPRQHCRSHAITHRKHARGWRTDPSRARATVHHPSICAGSRMSPKLPRVDCRQLVRALKRAGFEEQRQRGSHLHLRRAPMENGSPCQFIKDGQCPSELCVRFCAMQISAWTSSASFYDGTAYLRAAPPCPPFKSWCDLTAKRHWVDCIQ